MSYTGPGGRQSKPGLVLPFTSSFGTIPLGVLEYYYSLMFIVVNHKLNPGNNERWNIYITSSELGTGLARALTLLSAPFIPRGEEAHPKLLGMLFNLIFDLRYNILMGTLFYSPANACICTSCSCLAYKKFVYFLNIYLCTIFISSSFYWEIKKKVPVLVLGSEIELFMSGHKLSIWKIFYLKL